MAFCCMNSGVYGWFRTTMVGALVDGSRSRTEPRLLRRARIAVDVTLVRRACPLVTFRALLAFVSFSSGLPLCQG